MAPAKEDRTFYVIVRNEDDTHWTSASDFMDGKFFRERSSAQAYLSNQHILPKNAPAPLSTTTPGAVSRPTPTARSESTSSTSTVGSTSARGMKYEIRKIAARSLCGNWTWWFVDDEGNAAANGGASSTS